VLPGVYRESVLLTGFNFSDPVTVIGVEGGSGRPVIDGGGELTMGIAIIESSGFIIENLEFRNFTDEGMLATLAGNVTVRDVRFVSNGFASMSLDFDGEGFGFAAIGVTGLIVEDSEVFKNGPSPERQDRFILGMGIDTFEVRDAVIRNNRIHHNVGGGILVEDGIGVLVEGNVITDNELDANGDYWDGAIWVDGGSDVTVTGNTLSRNHGPGLQLSDEEGNGPTGYVVTGNTITDNLWGIYVWNFGVCPWPSPDVITVERNTFSANASGDLWCLEAN